MATGFIERFKGKIKAHVLWLGAGGITTSANDLTMAASNASSATGAGNAVSLAGGSGGSTSGAGGAVTVKGGDATAGNSNGGALTLEGGVKHGSGTVGNILMPTLPTADPLVAGALWSNSGVVTVSSGS